MDLSQNFQIAHFVTDPAPDPSQKSEPHFVMDPAPDPSQNSESHFVMDPAPDPSQNSESHFVTDPAPDPSQTGNLSQTASCHPCLNHGTVSRQAVTKWPVRLIGCFVMDPGPDPSQKLPLPVGTLNRNIGFYAWDGGGRGIL